VLLASTTAMYHEPVELSAAAAPLAMVCFDQSHQVGTVTATVNSGPRLHASVKFVNLPASTPFAIQSPISTLHVLANPPRFCSNRDDFDWDRRRRAAAM